MKVIFLDTESLVEIITLEKEVFNSTTNKIIGINGNALITQNRSIKM